MYVVLVVFSVEHDGQRKQTSRAFGVETALEARLLDELFTILLENAGADLAADSRMGPDWLEMKMIDAGHGDLHDLAAKLVRDLKAEIEREKKA